MPFNINEQSQNNTLPEWYTLWAGQQETLSHVTEDKVEEVADRALSLSPKLTTNIVTGKNEAMIKALAAAQSPVHYEGLESSSEEESSDEEAPLSQQHFYNTPSREAASNGSPATEKPFITSSAIEHFALYLTQQQMRKSALAKSATPPVGQENGSSPDIDNRASEPEDLLVPPSPPVSKPPENNCSSKKRKMADSATQNPPAVSHDKKRRKTIADHPEMSKQFSKKNPPESKQLTLGSHKEVFWTCDKDGHPDWKAKVNNITSSIRQKRSGCPECARQKHISHKTIADDPKLKALLSTKNPPGSENLTTGSVKVVLWTCTKGQGHKDYRCRVRSVKRSVAAGHSGCCPECPPSHSKYQTLDQHPILKNLYSKDNRPYRINVLTLKSGQPALWTCSDHGDWEAVVSKVAQAVQAGRPGCPKCTRQRGLTHKTIAEYPKLKALLSEDNPPGSENLSCGSGEVRNWNCSNKEHQPWSSEIKAVFNAVQKGNNGCQECASAKKRKHQTIAQHHELNILWSEENPPETKHLSCITNRPLMWQCAEKHTPWERSPKNVFSALERGSNGCPTCRQIRIKQGTNTHSRPKSSPSSKKRRRVVPTPPADKPQISSDSAASSTPSASQKRPLTSSKTPSLSTSKKRRRVVPTKSATKPQTTSPRKKPKSVNRTGSIASRMTHDPKSVRTSNKAWLLEQRKLTQALAIRIEKQNPSPSPDN